MNSLPAKRSGATIRLPLQAACSCEQFASEKVWSHDDVTMAIKLRVAVSSLSAKRFGATTTFTMAIKLRVAVSSLPSKRFGSTITLPWQAACICEQFASEKVRSHDDVTMAIKLPVAEVLGHDYVTMASCV